MYLPPVFTEPDPQERARIVQEHGLGILVSYTRCGLEANHLPFYLAENCLLAHVARANPVWQNTAEASDVMVVFRGAAGYISPNWYPGKQQTHRRVPTWNYEAVHAYGTLHMHEDVKFMRRVVGLLTRQHESTQVQPWRMGDAPKDYLDAQWEHMVGIEVRVQRWEVKRKLSQNQSDTDRKGVINALQSQDQHALAQAMATAMGPNHQQL